MRGTASLIMDFRTLLRVQDHGTGVRHLCPQVASVWGRPRAPGVGGGGVCLMRHPVRMASQEGAVCAGSEAGRAAGPRSETAWPEKGHGLRHTCIGGRGSLAF